LVFAFLSTLTGAGAGLAFPLDPLTCPFLGSLCTGTLAVFRFDRNTISLLRAGCSFSTTCGLLTKSLVIVMAVLFNEETNVETGFETGSGSIGALFSTGKILIVVVGGGGGAKLGSFDLESVSLGFKYFRWLSGLITSFLGSALAPFSQLFVSKPGSPML
jgi:hypothetical protein